MTVRPWAFIGLCILFALWLAWFSLQVLDLRDLIRASLTGRQHFVPPTADQTDEALRRFTFGGGNDGRAANIAVSSPVAVPGVQGHQDGTENGSTGRSEAGMTTGRDGGTHGE